MAMLFSSTTMRFAPASASRTAAMGQGRKQVMPSTPICWPCSRISSTVSLIVPSTEPSATTMASASSSAVGVHQAAALAAEDAAEFVGPGRE